jgi:hypothetical protein
MPFVAPFVFCKAQKRLVYQQDTGTADDLAVVVQLGGNREPSSSALINLGYLLPQCRLL